MKNGDMKWSVAKKTVERKTGARGLRSIMEHAMMDVMYELPSKEHVKKCTITKDVIDGTGDPVIEYEETSGKGKKIS